MAAATVRGLLGIVGVAGLMVSGGCNHPYTASSSSMSPLIRSGDRIFVDESDDARTHLVDGEVIVFRHGDSVLMKRIAALPGETIRGENRRIYRNGVEVKEPYLAPVGKEDEPFIDTFGPETVAPGELFVLGDNRDHSLDSRAPEYGPVRLSDVMGRYSAKYWRGR